jgi:hypothetical protein
MNWFRVANRLRGRTGFAATGCSPQKMTGRFISTLDERGELHLANVVLFLASWPRRQEQSFHLLIDGLALSSPDFGLVIGHASDL